MHARNGLVVLQTSIDSEKKKKQKKKQKKKKRLVSLFSRSSRVPEIVMLNAQDNTIPARTAAFATNEILHLILSNVPIKHYANVRRVSKTWNKVVSKIGYYINPINIHTNLPNWPYSYPEYPDTIPIVFNPIFSRGRPPRPIRSSREHYEARFQADCLFYTHYLRKLGEQFFTNPPVTHVALAASPVAPGGASSMLTVRDGIRLQDLAEALEGFCKLNRGGDAGLVRKLLFNAFGLDREDYEKCGGYSVGVHLFCVEGEGRRVEENLLVRLFGHGPERKTD